MSDTPFDRFKALLEDIFQFDTGDLDFGIYRILNARRKQIEAFIENDLQAVVDQAFGEYAATKSEVASAGLEAAKAKVIAALGEDAFDADGQVSLVYQNANVVKEYVREAAAATQATATDSLKNKVYNDLLAFFARYYDDGDFLPLRRAGRENTYHVPYNGEEVVLHWANKGQYYIKTDDKLAAYKFKAGEYHVSLEVRSATTELNNNKGAKRFYLLADGDSEGYAVYFEPDTKTLHVYFTQRPLTPDEETKFTGNSKQEAINKAIYDTVIARVKEVGLNAALATPYKIKEGETAPANVPPTLLRHLIQFTKKNTADFFIHKNLSAFLTAELDGFIKTECLRLDELLNVSDADFALQRARARATKTVGDKIIALLSSVEDFQKRLFEKRKFVTTTEYVFTLDRVPVEWHQAVLDCESQVQEWRDLYDLDGLIKADALLGGTGLTLETLATEPYNRLPVDTSHFDWDFKADLLANVDDLDTLTDGVLFNSENFQALNLMTEAYRERVKCIYIDPPYNTDGDGFIYKDSYRHSTWLSMIADRIQVVKGLLNNSSSFYCQLDHNESSRLKLLLDETLTFQREIIWSNESSAGFKAQANNWIRGHDTIYFYSLGDSIDFHKQYLELAESTKKRYDKIDEDTGDKYKEYFDDDGTVRKVFLKDSHGKPLSTVWTDILSFQTDNSSREHVDFDTQKPTRLISRMLKASNLSDNEYAFDFFAGSGTTGHSVINLNREDNGSRKYILCEMGAYFNTVLLPRLKKAAFASQWKEGKTFSRDPISQTIKYHVLEQYEDTLNNLQLRPEAESQLAMEMYGEDYLLRYLLDFDTAGSPSLLNLEQLADPFHYALRVKDGDDFRNQVVDLPETFSYLLGLQVRKVRRFVDGDREYRAVLGADRKSKTVAHLWRKSSDLTGDAEALKRDAAFIRETVLPALLDTRPDRLFINGAFAGIEGAENCEPELHRLMFAGVGA